ncbi:MAG: ornithine carbamoyltransferase [Desulfovibrionaceae bacterium]
MVRRVFTLQDLGQAGTWLLMQQANGIPDPRGRSSFMAGRTALLMFAEDGLADRLCVTAAVRQMGGQVVYVSQGRWLEDMRRFPIELSPIYDYYVDCAYIMGLSIRSAQEKEKYLSRIPTINISSLEASPAHAIANLACMLRFSGRLEGVQVAWMGAPNGTLYSLMQAAAYFPFSLRMALPDTSRLDRNLFDALIRDGARLEVVEQAVEAVSGADYVCVGCGEGLTTAQLSQWQMDGSLLEHAPGAYVMITSRNIAETLPVLPQILEGPRSLVLLQSENLLRVHKRMLHWVFEENGED